MALVRISTRTTSPPCHDVDSAIADRKRDALASTDYFPVLLAAGCVCRPYIPTPMPQIDPPKITPFLWFNNQAEEAMNFYVSIFGNSKVIGVTRFGEGGPGPKGTVMSATFELEGQRFHALNGGPHFTFTPAVSFFVNCESQEEVDELWQKLCDGGEESQCGWLKDRYGLSWQIVPSILGKLMQDKDPVKAGNVVKAMLQMRKLDIGVLQNAYDAA
jgi:predicted 3-demethylubiquinone-9 3-methyltransferase (glyoxalase superfamily)